MNDDEYFGLRPQTSSSSSPSLLSLANNNVANNTNNFQSTNKLTVPNSPIRQLAPLSETSSSTFFGNETNHLSRPQTQSSQLHSLPSPITNSSTSLSRPLTQQSRSSGYDNNTNIPSVVFPTSNTDTIPSANSAIVKYKSSREYMLDKLQLPTKEQRENALKRSIERGTPLPLRSTQDSQQSSRKSLSENTNHGNSQSQSQSRYQSSLNQSNPLTKIGISNDKGIIIILLL